jgi:hypothetical protein
VTAENRQANVAVEVRVGREALAAADALLALGIHRDAVSRLYYAAYHFATAALLAVGVRVRSHHGLVSLFAQHLVQPGLLPKSCSKDLSQLLAQRGEADYNAHYEFDEEDAREDRERTLRLVTTIGAFLRARGHDVA